MIVYMRFFNFAVSSPAVVAPVRPVLRAVQFLVSRQAPHTRPGAACGGCGSCGACGGCGGGCGGARVGRTLGERENSLAKVHRHDYDIIFPKRCETLLFGQ
jgi:hypothetical protein